MDKTKENQEKLRGMVLEMFPQLQEEAKEANTLLQDEVAALKETNVDMKNKIEALENAPVKKVNLQVPGDNKTIGAIYKGRNLFGAGAKLSLAPDRKEAVAKMFIDFLDQYLRRGKASINILEKANPADSSPPDLSEGVGGTVGYLVFPDYVNELLAFAREQSVALQDCRIMNVSSDSVYIPREDTNGITVAWTNELDQLTQKNPVVELLNLTPKKLGAYVRMSNELLADTEFDLVSWLTELFAEGIARELDGQVWSGIQFTALIGAANIVSVTSASDATTSINIDMLAETIAALPSYKAQGARFYFHRNNFRWVRVLEDGGGNAVYTPAMAGAPGAIWEYPYTLSEQMPSTYTAGDCIGVFGNLKNYIIARRSGDITLEADPYGAFTYDITRFRVKVRFHGAPWNASGFVQMLMGS